LIKICICLSCLIIFSIIDRWSKLDLVISL
jgi:hypothetical protein